MQLNVDRLEFALPKKLKPLECIGGQRTLPLVSINNLRARGHRFSMIP